MPNTIISIFLQNAIRKKEYKNASQQEKAIN